MYKKALSFLLLVIAASIFSHAFATEVNVYTYRQPHLIKPLLNKWSHESGIKTNILYIKDGIAERLQFEGFKSPADLLLTTDIYRLTELKEKELTQPVESSTIAQALAAPFRDTENHWFALTIRARVIYANGNPQYSPVGEVQSYTDLAQKDLGKRVCTRPLSHIYNLGLVASFIAQQGEKATVDWLTQIKANLARRPQGNDRTQIKAISQGLCDYAIGNSYYFGLLAHNEPKWTQNIRIITPKVKNGGTHINISGMALARYAPHKKETIQLMEFLVSEQAQEYYASVNYEFPARDGTSPSAFLKDTFGQFDRQQLALTTLAQFASQAQLLIEQVGIDY